MPGSSLATQDDLLRTVYVKEIQDSVPLNTVLLQTLERNEVDFAPGKEISLLNHTGTGSGPSASDEYVHVIWAEKASGDLQYEVIYTRKSTAPEGGVYLPIIMKSSS